MNQISKSEANKLRLRLHEVRDKKARTDFEFCGLLHQVYYSSIIISKKRVPLYAFWGHGSWEEFAEKETGLHGNTAGSYRRVWDVFMVQLKGQWDKSLLQPITKMKLLTHAEMDKGNVNKWLRTAAQMTCCELEDYIYGKAATKTVSVRVSISEARRLKKLLDRNKRVFNTGSRGDVLINILEEWDRAKGAVRKLSKTS